MLICSECVLTVSGGTTASINGEWKLDDKKSENGRPVFRKGKQLVYFMTHRNFGRWYITNEEGRVGSASNVIAFVNSEVKSPNLLERGAVWSERSSPKKGKFNSNDNIVFSGDCVKPPKKPDLQEAKVRNQDGCPRDETYRTIKNEDWATVHWTDPVAANQDHEIVYQSRDTTPGSRFKVGKTGVVYSVRRAGRIIRTCDFVITVEDRDPPVFECPNDIFVDIEAGKSDVFAEWDIPKAHDAVEGKVKVTQVKGPSAGSTLKKGIHRVIYEAKDSMKNVVRCVFRIRVQDKIPPIVLGCPKDLTIEVYEANKWSAHPKWILPSGVDSVDGRKVSVTQVAGLKPGEEFTVASNNEENTSTQIYHVQDLSGNVATCQFQIKLRKSHGSVEGEDFTGELETDSPQAPDEPQLNKAEQQRPERFNKLREEETSSLQKVMAAAKERQRLMQEFASGGHVSKEHLERLKKMKMEEKDVSPRMSTLPDESSSSWLWTLFKVATIVIPLAGLGGGLVLYFTGYLFAPKGKRVPSQSNLNVPRNWMRSKSEDNLRRRRV